MITDDVRKTRNQYIGSSDVAAILGLDPWRGPADVLAEKRGLVPPKEESQAMRLGTNLEPVILAEFRAATGLDTVASHRSWISGRVRVHPDAFIGAEEAGNPIVEAKYTTSAEGWGDSGSVEVPDRVLVQVLVQAAVVGSPLAYVAVLRPVRDRLTFAYHPIVIEGENRTLADKLLANCERWWKRHVEDGEPLPAGTPPATLDTLASLQRDESASAVLLSDDLVRELAEARKQLGLAEERESIAWRRVLDALGDATAGVSTLGRVSYKRTKDRADVDWSRLEREHAAIVDQYRITKPGYLVKRFTPAKGEA